ncbi:MAG: SPFH domain-containing protein [Myxococcota bacterium]
MRSAIIAALGLAATFALTSVAGCTNPHTPAGHDGYVFEDPRLLGEGGFRGEVRGPGNYGTSPFRNQIINIDTRPTTYTEEFRILVKDDLNVAFRVHVVMQVEQGTVQTVVEDYGATDWYARFLRDPFRTIVRESVQEYTSRELKSEREAITTTISEGLAGYLADAPFRVVRLAV